MWLNKCLATKKNDKFQLLDIIYIDIGIDNMIFM